MSGPYYSFNDALRATVGDEVKQYIAANHELIEKTKSEFTALKWAFEGLRVKVESLKEELHDMKYNVKHDEEDDD